MTPKSSPYIDNNGAIVIPFIIDQKYHFWNGDHPLSITLQQLNAPEELWRQYIKKPYPGKPAKGRNNKYDFEVTSQRRQELLTRQGICCPIYKSLSKTIHWTFPEIC